MRMRLIASAVMAACLVPLCSGAARAASRFDLESARIPAVCGHPPARLSGGVKQFGSRPDGTSRGEATLVSRSASFTAPIKNPVFAAQRGSSRLGASVVAPIRCSAGGVDHPETLVLWSRSGAVLASTGLGAIAQQEHAVVTAVSLRGDHLRAHWDAYDGAGFDVHHQAATFTLRHGRLVASRIDHG